MYCSMNIVGKHSLLFIALTVTDSPRLNQSQLFISNVICKPVTKSLRETGVPKTFRHVYNFVLFFTSMHPNTFYSAKPKIDKRMNVCVLFSLLHDLVKFIGRQLSLSCMVQCGGCNQGIYFIWLLGPLTKNFVLRLQKR